jgi:hypothetical protein
MKLTQQKLKNNTNHGFIAQEVKAELMQMIALKMALHFGMIESDGLQK